MKKDARISIDVDKIYVPDLESLKSLIGFRKEVKKISEFILNKN